MRNLIPFAQPQIYLNIVIVNDDDEEDSDDNQLIDKLFQVVEDLKEKVSRWYCSKPTVSNSII